MTIVSSIVKNGIEYTKKGCRLLSKQRILGAEKMRVPLSFKPSGVPYTDVVKVETDFGKVVKTITSEMSSEGKLVHRTITETRNGEVVGEIIKDYAYDGAIKTVKTVNKGRGGFLLGESSETVNWLGHNVTDTGIIPIVSRVKFDKQFGAGGERLEHQLYETFAQGQGRTKYLETYAKRLSDGQVVDTRVTGAGVNVQALSSDPYLFIRNYDMKDFANSVRWIAEKNQRVDGLAGDFVLAPIKKCNGYYRDINSKVVVDVTSPLQTKTDLVDTINHEYRHKFQHKKGSQFIQRFLNLFRSEGNKVRIYKDWGYAIKNKFSEIIYPFTTFTQKGYWNNFLEVDARKAGKFASDVYKLNSEILAKAFGGPDRMYFVNETTGIFNSQALKSVIQDAINNGKVVTMPLSLSTLKK